MSALAPLPLGDLVGDGLANEAGHVFALAEKGADFALHALRALASMAYDELELRENAMANLFASNPTLRAAMAARLG